MTLFSYAYEGNEIQARDLRALSVLSPIAIEAGPLRSVEVLDHYAECLAVCSNQFEVFDLRRSRVKPVIEKTMDFSPMFAKMMDSAGPCFGIAGRKSRVSFLDLREPMNVGPPIVYQDAKGEVETRGLSWSSTFTTMALSHEGGISLFDPVNWGPMHLPKLTKFGNNVANTSAMLWHESKFSLAFVHDETTIVKVGEKGGVR
jgi:hypothetical protein